MTAPEDPTSCNGCRYAEPRISDKSDVLLFECLRYPPQLFYIDEEFMNVFPDAIRRCGEYRKTNEEMVKDLTDALRKMREEREARNNEL